MESVINIVRSPLLPNTASHSAFISQPTPPFIDFVDSKFVSFTKHVSSLYSLDSLGTIEYGSHLLDCINWLGKRRDIVVQQIELSLGSILSLIGLCDHVSLTRMYKDLELLDKCLLFLKSEYSLNEKQSRRHDQNLAFAKSFMFRSSCYSDSNSITCNVPVAAIVPQSSLVVNRQSSNEVHVIVADAVVYSQGNDC